jgi:hypothetical protein
MGVSRQSRGFTCYKLVKIDLFVAPTIKNKPSDETPVLFISSATIRFWKVRTS